MNKYIPNTYNYSLIKSKFADIEEFYNYQKIYKLHFEQLFKKILKIDELEKSILDYHINIPYLDDSEYNFYHKSSGLGSHYIYIRNNYHIENLDNNELEVLKSKNINESFIYNTYQKVLYEKNVNTFFGVPSPNTEVNSRSIIIEFAFDQKKCLSLKELKNIEKLIKEIFEKIQQNINNKFSLSFLVYNAIPDIFKNNYESLSNSVGDNKFDK